jgi:hypothetical protein
MVAPKTLPQREQELHGFVRTPEGRAELSRLERVYGETVEWRASRSLITNIIICERTAGLFNV